MRKIVSSVHKVAVQNAHWVHTGELYLSAHPEWISSLPGYLKQGIFSHNSSFWRWATFFKKKINKQVVCSIMLDRICDERQFPLSLMPFHCLRGRCLLLQAAEWRMQGCVTCCTTRDSVATILRGRCVHCAVSSVSLHFAIFHFSSKASRGLEPLLLCRSISG